MAKSMDRAVATQMQARIAQEKERAISALITGTSNDFSEYRYACGYIKCLDDMHSVAEEVLSDLQSTRS
jgi:hypothetical protein